MSVNDDKSYDWLVEWPWRPEMQEVPVAPSAPRAPESRVFEP